MVVLTEETPPTELAEQVYVFSVSEVMLTAPHPALEMMPDSGSATVQVRLTSETYQPLLPSVPTTFGVI